MDAPRRLGIGVVLVATILVAIPHAAAQSTPSLAQWRLEQIVGSAGARADDYFALFSDLTATETKTVEEFRDSGQVSARREIVSDLIVYKSQVDRGSIAEYRDVKFVDGVPVTGREQRVLALFERSGRADSVRDELARVNREGSRYDLDHTIAGLTIGQALPVRATSRSFFEFSLDGEDRIEGHPVLVLSYRQVAQNPRFGLDLSLPSDFRHASPSYRGRLWIDAATSQVWREVREVVVAPETGAPVVVQRFEFDYTPSPFDVPLPKRIVFSAFLHFSKRDGAISPALSYRITFAYGEFRRFTTTSDEGEIARVAPPDPAPPGAESPTATAPEPATATAPPAESLGPEFGPDAPLGPPDPQPEQPRPQPQPQPQPPPRPRPSPRRAVPMIGASLMSTPAPVGARDLLTSVPAPAPPVISISPPPPPPAPGARFRIPPS